ncbi:MAG TPA: glycosyltransferase family 39 protein, partial [Gemmatimonadales bacterium]
MLERLVRLAHILAGAALFVRLGGMGRDWLPSAPVLAAAVVGLLLASLLLERRTGAAGGAGRAWRGLLERHGFAVGLAALGALALLVRLPGIAGDLGHVPLDIDEHRLAANVRRFFVTGEIGHSTVEHYPGVLFWVLTGASLLAYLWSLMEGTVHGIRDMPVESFVLAGRVTNTGIAAATVIMTGLLGRELSGRAAGLLAAALVAVAPLSVQTTTVLRNDPSQALLGCAAVYAALVAWTRGGHSRAAAAGLLAGVATGIKYTSVFALLPAVLAPALRGPAASRAARTGLALGAFTLAVVV